MGGAVLRDQVTFLDATFESERNHGAFQEMKSSHVYAFHFLKCLAVFSPLLGYPASIQQSLQEIK
jgi:hypothetical protein